MINFIVKVKKLFFNIKMILVYAFILILSLLIFSIMSGSNPIILLIMICFILIFVIFFLYFSTKEEELKKIRIEYENIKRENEKLIKQNLTLQHSRFNVQSIKEIFEIALFEVASNIYRVMDETVVLPKKNKVRYFGVLRVDLEAKYGISTKEIIVTVDTINKIIYLSNINARFIGFSKRKTEWEISEVLEEKSLLNFFDKYWRTNNKYEKELAEKKEEFRKKLEEEIETRGIKEFEFLQTLMKEKIEKTLSVFLNQYGYTLKTGTNPEITPIPLEEFLDNHERYLKE